VVQLREEGHLGSELEHASLVELLLDEPLHRHLDALPPTAVYDAVGAQAHLPTHLDVLEVDDPPAEVGRREEVVFVVGNVRSMHLHLILVVTRLRWFHPIVVAVCPAASRTAGPGARRRRRIAHHDPAKEPALQPSNLQLVHPLSSWMKGQRPHRKDDERMSIQ
jgi:hypothetical protein